MYNQRIDNKDLLIMQMIHGQSPKPSIHEMRAAIRARSTGTVANRLEKLQRLGYVTQPQKRQPRSREVTASGEEVLRGARIISDEAI